MKLFTIIIGFFMGLMPFFAQECSYYHRKNCINKEVMPMTYDSQSRSAILSKGQTSEFHLVAYNGLDYRVSICSEPILGESIQFRIYEKKRVLVKVEDEAVIEEDDEKEEEEEEYEDDEYEDDEYEDDEYEDDEYEDEDDEEDYQETSFKKKEPVHRIVKELLYDNKDDGYNTQIEFTAEGAMSLIVEVLVPGSGRISKLSIRETGCVGVLVEHRKSKRIGF